jgi:hypothetical protein
MDGRPVSLNRRASLKREAAKRTPSAAPAEAAVPEAAPSVADVAPVVTLDTPGDSRAQAQTMVDQAFQQLGEIDRPLLKGDAARLYDQAAALAESGRKALQDGDYVAAEGYARKASMLASDLAQGSALQ